MTRSGYVVGANGTILRTNDGGETWQDQESAFSNNLYAVEIYKPNEAVAVGELGRVLWTEDGGRIWKLQPNITNNSLQAVRLSRRHKSMDCRTRRFDLETL